MSEIIILIFAWFIIGLIFSFALIHHIKIVSGRETYNYLKEIGQGKLFNSRKYCIHFRDLKVAAFMSVLGPINFVLFLIKCLADVIVLVINVLTK